MRDRSTNSRPVLGAALLALGTSLGCGGDGQHAPAVALTELMGGGDLEGFARADAPRAFRFPADHAAHREFLTEWWYVTGNLGSAAGERFGFHLTIFRRGLPRGPRAAASLAADELYLAHFAIADGRTGDVHAHERTARGAGGLAGATLDGDALRVWLEDWEFSGDVGSDPVRLRLRAREADDALDLELHATRPPVLQGDAGLSQKGSGDGQASFYYAIPRLEAAGSVQVDGAAVEVSGSAWLDREWSTSALGESQVGWDWFALQLTDGTDLMLYQMRLADGGVDATSHGSVTEGEGEHRKLEASEYAIEALDTWTSPRSGGRYPSQWRVSVPGEGLELEIDPLFPDQELPFAVVYWEGAVSVRGTRNGQPLEGVGFVELTGYADQAADERAARR
ncbi:MAG: lipocalin-like domain-containing protein [Planctomycetota bacterium]